MGSLTIATVPVVAVYRPRVADYFERRRRRRRQYPYYPRKGKVASISSTTSLSVCAFVCGACVCWLAPSLFLGSCAAPAAHSLFFVVVVVTLSVCLRGLGLLRWLAPSFYSQIGAYYMNISFSNLWLLEN